MNISPAFLIVLLGFGIFSGCTTTNKREEVLPVRTEESLVEEKTEDPLSQAAKEEKTGAVERIATRNELQDAFEKGMPPILGKPVKEESPMLWAKNGYVITVPETTILLWKVPVAQDEVGVVLEHPVREYIPAKEVLTALRGIAKAEEMSLVREIGQMIPDTEGYEGERGVCTITLANGAVEMDEQGENFVGVRLQCTGKDEVVVQALALKPLQDALSWKENSIMLRKTEGAFALYSVGAIGGGGWMSMVKKEGETYREIFAGQDIPECAVVEKEGVPKALYESCAK